MTFSALFHDISGIFHRLTAQGEAAHARTLVEIADAAESDRLDQMLSDAGISAESVGEATPVRRKWSELEAFDRSTFDHEAYTRSLED